jgi:hypothetical protein
MHALRLSVSVSTLNVNAGSVDSFMLCIKYLCYVKLLVSRMVDRKVQFSTEYIIATRP